MKDEKNPAEMAKEKKTDFDDNLRELWREIFKRPLPERNVSDMVREVRDD